MQLANIITLLTVSGLGFISALEPIKFDGGELVKTRLSDSTGRTTLYSLPDLSKNQESGVQFPYTKGPESSESVGLATVYLETPMGLKSLQTMFAPIAQTCSCYWLEANDLLKRIPGLTSGSNYAIVMISDSNKFTVRSGRFSIDLGSNNPKPDPIPQPKPPVRCHRRKSQ